MIRAITVENWMRERLRMELTHPERSGLVIFNIEGIGAPNADINVTDIAGFDGGFFNSSRATTRNIVLSLKHLPIPSIEHTRRMSYRFFPLQKPMRLVFETENGTREIWGYVESNDPVVFSPQHHSRISIICPRPYFQETRDHVTIFSATEPMFEFPFSNESLTENLMVMSEAKQSTVETIYYHGDVETGVVIRIFATDVVIDPSVHNLDTRENITFDFSMRQRDAIIISTVPGEKYIHLLREGVTTNIINTTIEGTRFPDWFKLSKGANTFAYAATHGETNMEFRLSRRSLYEGV